MVKLTAAYQKAYGSLNKEQKQAVDQVDGPVLVVAGPGTGKTQLLSTRIGRILETTDSAPENILCLTFSESAAAAMQDRLASLIGPSANDVSVSTYHSFGSDLITRYAELFNLQPGIKPSDDLALDRAVREVCNQLPYSNPYKDELYTSDVKELISGYKRSLITPEILLSTCDANESFINQAAALVNDCLTLGERTSKKAIAKFRQLLNGSDGLTEIKVDGITSLKQLWLESLGAAVEEAEQTNNTPPLTKWRVQWLEADRSGKYTLCALRSSQRQRAMAEILANYNQELAKQGLYDYDDMIMLAIKGLEEHTDVKLTLQERYQYILLDEFQDTNEAQLKLVELLADNEVNERRPNVLAVGDDDQAIYSFQGAHYSHMQRFYDNYRDVSLITLKINYRSAGDIIKLGQAFREQIGERLSLSDKDQQPFNKTLAADLSYVELPLSAEHLAWTAEHIAALIKRGEDPSDIAVLAPKHQLLIDLIPYLHAHNIPISYDQRDNIFDDDLIRQLLTISRLVVNLDDSHLANHLWPEVLSYDFWQLPTSLLWQLSWESRKTNDSWSELMLKNDLTKPIALFMARLQMMSDYSSFEQLLNYIIGSQELELNEAQLKSYASPFYGYNFKHLSGDSSSMPADEWRLLSHLTQLRARARASSEHGLNLMEFVDFADDYANAGLKIVDKTPFKEAAKAVTLMTAFASKGQEFKTIVLIDFCDRLWGKSRKNQSSRITLPANLAQVRKDNNGDDDKLRLLFVAISRAKQRIVMVNYASDLSGKEEKRLHYCQIEEDDGHFQSPVLDRAVVKYLTPSAAASGIESIRPAWFDRHLEMFNPELKALLETRLKNFYLSATKLNAYSDLSNGGPRQFYKEQILEFPSAPTISSQFGSAIHGTLDWHFKQTKQNAKPPSMNDTFKEFENRLSSRRLTKLEFEQLKDRGVNSLSEYFSQTSLEFNPNDLSEEKLQAVLGKARLSGAIDRLKIDEQAGTIHIIDFKTGKSYDKFGGDIKSFHHRRQLYFYKLLIELNPKFKKYKVTKGTVQFVEPDRDSGLIAKVDLEFDTKTEEELKLLIGCVWDNIMKLNFPASEGLGRDLSAIKRFENNLTNPAYVPADLPGGNDLVSSAAAQ